MEATLEPSASLEALLSSRKKFLGFLSSRVGEEAAEDILQTAYIKAMQHEDQIEKAESITAWFYRILRNSVIDHYRRSTTRTQALEQYASQQPDSYEHELEAQACACIKEVIADLKPEYREAIQQMDLYGQTPDAFAKAQGLTANNASVRLHRARKAVAARLTSTCGACAEHKCLDCTCRKPEL